MIPLESIRVSRLPYPEVDPPDSERITVEWCVTGDPERDPWCSGSVRHVHHRAMRKVVPGHIFTATSHSSWAWSTILEDPYADDPDELNVVCGWLHPAYLRPEVVPGWHAELYLPKDRQIRLEVEESGDLLGCSGHNPQFYSHICLIGEEPAA